MPAPPQCAPPSVSRAVRATLGLGEVANSLAQSSDTGAWIPTHSDLAPNVCVIKSSSYYSPLLTPPPTPQFPSFCWEGREGLVSRPSITLVELLQDRFSLRFPLRDRSAEVSPSSPPFPQC